MRNIYVSWIAAACLFCAAGSAVAQNPLPEKSKTGTAERATGPWISTQKGGLTPSATQPLWQPLPGSPENYLLSPTLQPGASVPDIVRDPVSGQPLFIEQKNRYSQRGSFSTEQAASQAQLFMQDMGNAFRIQHAEDEMHVLQTETDDLGHTHVKMQQEWMGVPVYGAEAIVHFDQTGNVRMTGRLQPSCKLTDVSPAISDQDAINVAMAQLAGETVITSLTAEQQTMLGYTGPVAELVIYPLEGITTSYKLAWKFTLRPNFLRRYEFYVDAKTGAILLHYDNTCSLGPATATGNDLNGVSRTVNTFQDTNGTYYLVDASKPMYTGTNNVLPAQGKGIILTGDMNNSNTSNPSYNYIVSNNNTWNAKSISAHYNASVSHDYFKNVFQRNSINGSGGDINSFINVRDENNLSMDNAFWNGAAMFYGNGATDFLPLAGGLDVAGHEMTHGVVQNSANLEYQGESGALNESFADIFGSMIDRNDWLIGEDVVKLSAFPSGALRSMQDPHNGGSSLNSPGYQPRHVNEQYTGTQDNGGVHINSGIPNWAFFKFATAVTKDKAEKVYYRALTVYLTKSSQFVDERIAVIQAATDLYGANSAEVSAAATAFDQVGIPGPSGGNQGGGSGGSNYQTQLPPNPGADFIVSTDTDVNPFEIYLSSTTGTNFQGLTTTIPRSKISVTDNGQYGYFVSEDHHIKRVRMNATTPQETQLSNQPEWDNVAISKDGNLLAAVSSSIDTSIYIFNLAANPITGIQYILYNPSFTQGVSTGGVHYADAIEFDHSGQYVMYDSYNEIPNISGTNLTYWDVGFINVWNKATNNFGDGTITKVFTNLPSGVSVGNPAFSKNSTAVIAFDYINDNTSQNLLMAANLESGEVNEIFNNQILSYPNFSNLDNKLIFNANDLQGSPVVAQISLQANKITPSGTATVLIGQAKWGVWYATGVRNLNVSIEPEFLAGSSFVLAPNPATSNSSLLVSLKAEASLQFRITDVMGKTLWSTSARSYPAGDSRVTLDLESLASGMYLVQVISAGEIYTQRLVKP